MITGGLAFAIPSITAAEFLRAQFKPQGGLGVVLQPVWVGRSRRLGFVVLKVIPGSPADRGSLLSGDLLVGTDGKRFNSVEDLDIGIHASLNGILELQFRRGGSQDVRTVAIQLAPFSVRAA